MRASTADGSFSNNIAVTRLFTQPFIQAQIKDKILKLRITGLCAGNSLVTGEFPAQMASNAENVWSRHHDKVNLASIMFGCRYLHFTSLAQLAVAITFVQY